MEYIPLYTTTPMQVKYLDLETDTYKGGIVFNDILFFSNGDITNVNDYIFKVADRLEIDIDNVVISLSWNDLSSAILTPQKQSFLC